MKTAFWFLSFVIAVEIQEYVRNNFDFPSDVAFVLRACVKTSAL
jgi:hypothetical protein